MKKNILTNFISQRVIIRLLLIIATTFLAALGLFQFNKNTFALDDSLPAGTVVSVTLTSGDTYRFVLTGQSEGDYIYLVGLDNACEIEEVGCTNRNGLVSTATTTYNAGPNSYNNNLSTSEDRSITTQTTNFFSILPADLRNVVRTTSWDMHSVERTVGATTNLGDCGIDDVNCEISEPVFLVSYEEWQGGLLGYTEEPADGSVGDVWCMARYGASECKTTEIYIDYNFPWLRTPEANSDTRVWSLRGMTGYSVNLDLAFSDGGLLPAMWVDSTRLDLAESVGDGSFDNPYVLTVTEDPGPDPGEPTISLSVPSTLDMNVVPTPNGKLVDDNIIASVTTDGEEGYILTMHNPDTDNVIRHWDDQGVVLPTDNDTTTPSGLAQNRWGYNTINSPNEFLKTPIAPFVINSSSGPVDPDTTTITIGANVNTEIPAGVYYATLTFTAIANPVP